MKLLQLVLQCECALAGMLICTTNNHSYFVMTYQKSEIIINNNTRESDCMVIYEKDHMKLSSPTSLAGVTQSFPALDNVLLITYLNNCTCAGLYLSMALTYHKEPCNPPFS